MTITAEQARALHAGITPGPWGHSLLDTDLHLEKKAKRSLFRGGYFGYAVWNMTDKLSKPVIAMLPMCDVDHQADALAIAAVPDMLATIIADADENARMAARIEALEALGRRAMVLIDAQLREEITDCTESEEIADGFRAALNGETA